MRRPESANLLRRLFAEAERSEWWRGREGLLLAAKIRVPRIPVRRETVIYGRDDDLDRLRRAWLGAAAGEGLTLLLEGEAGIGKTRLLSDFLEHLEGEDVRILYGAFPPSGGSGGLCDGIVEHFGAAGLRNALARYLTVTPRLVPAFEAWIRREVPPEGSESIQGEVLHAVMVHLVKGMADERPLVWVVDDLQFAEPESRQVLLSIARGLGEHRALLIAATRPGIPEDELANFSRLSNFRRLSLSRLGARDVIELLRAAFRSDVLADRLGAKIAFKSDGVPLFVFEMIRGLTDGRFLEELPDGSFVETRLIEEIDVPSAVRDLIAGRLLSLSREERSILDVAAVQGFEFDAGLVADVLARKKLVVLQALAEIERRTGVIRSDGGQCQFDHHQIQEVLYEDLMGELRAEYHALLADAVAERAGGTDALADGSMHLFAWHHLNGSRPSAAIDYLIPALEHLSLSYRTESAVTLIDRALGSPGLVEGVQRAALLLRKIAHLAVLGRADRERAALDEALELVEREGVDELRGRVGAALGSHFARRGLYDDARDALERAVTGARDAGDLALEADVEGALGSVARSLGRFENSVGHYERSRELSVRAGDRRSEAKACGGLGLVLSSMGRYEEAREQHEHALALARETGDRRTEAYALMNLGSVRWFQGFHEEAIELDESALALLREIGDRSGEASAMGNLGILIQSSGRFDEALRYHERLLGMTREMGNATSEATCHGCLGNDFVQIGDYSAAREHFESWIAIARDTGGRPSEGIGRMSLGNLLATLGDLDEARALLTESREILIEIGARREESYSIHALGVLAEREGDLGGAVARYREALALRREIDYPAGIAGALVALGRIEAGSGDWEAAGEYLEEALDIARKLSLPGEIVIGEAARSRLPGVGTASALRALADHEETLTPLDRLQASFLVWESGGDMAQLEVAYRLLCGLRDRAPEEYRRTMMENVPLHREIVAAWEGVE